MKKIWTLLVAFTLIFTLVSCGEDESVPDGMQLARGGEEFGYNFFVPEEWIVANHGEISVAYASKIDTTSVSFTKAEMPEGTVAEYFAKSVENEFSFTPNITVGGEKCDFGNAKEAYKFIYDYEYQTHPMRSMQIFVIEGGEFYIFTFTSQLTKRGEEVTYYDFYLEKVQKVIDNFRFTEKAQSTTDTTEYEKDSDGYLLVSDRALSGFDMYIPADWSVRYSSAAVGISKPDGSSVNLTEATSGGVSTEEYWNIRKSELQDIGAVITEIEVMKQTALGNSRWAFSFEYKYTYAGREYHVYQVLGVSGPTLNQSGYVLTYTAPEEVYSQHIEEVQKIIQKVNFR